MVILVFSFTIFFVVDDVYSRPWFLLLFAISLFSRFIFLFFVSIAEELWSDYSVVIVTGIYFGSLLSKSEPKKSSAAFLCTVTFMLCQTNSVSTVKRLVLVSTIEFIKGTDSVSSTSSLVSVKQNISKKILTYNRYYKWAYHKV